MKLSRPAIRKCSVSYGDHDEANESIILDVKKRKISETDRQTAGRPDRQRKGGGGSKAG